MDQEATGFCDVNLYPPIVAGVVSAILVLTRPFSDITLLAGAILLLAVGGLTQ